MDPARTPRGFCHRLLTAGGETHVSAEVGQFSRWGRGARPTRRVREEYLVYFDRNATKNGAKRSGSGGMHRRPNAAWVLPQAVKPAPRSRRVPEPSPRGRGADRGFDRRWREPGNAGVHTGTAARRAAAAETPTVGMALFSRTPEGRDGARPEGPPTPGRVANHGAAAQRGQILGLHNPPQIPARRQRSVSRKMVERISV